MVATILNNKVINNVLIPPYHSLHTQVMQNILPVHNIVILNIMLEYHAELLGE
jgi:hypothetical protein